MVADLPRVEAELLERPRAGTDSLLLISRRHLRSNNSWMHNAWRLVKGPERCDLLMHPRDAEARGLRSGERVAVRSRTGEVCAALTVSDEMMPGVVCLPHGWGHDRPGVRLRVATRRAGVSINDLTDETLVDPVSGNAALSGVEVTVGARAPTCPSE